MACYVPQAGRRAFSIGMDRESMEMKIVSVPGFDLWRYAKCDQHLSEQIYPPHFWALTVSSNGFRTQFWPPPVPLQPRYSLWTWSLIPLWSASRLRPYHVVSGGKGESHGRSLPGIIYTWCVTDKDDIGNLAEPGYSHYQRWFSATNGRANV